MSGSEFSTPRTRRIANLESKLSSIGEDIAYLRGKFEDVPGELEDLKKQVHGNDKKILGLSLVTGTGAGAIGSFIKNFFISG